MLNNKPVDVIDICNDNEEVADIDNNVVTDKIINEVTEEVTDKIINEITEEFVDKNNKVIQNKVHMNKYDIEEKVNDKFGIIDIVKEKSLQDEMYDHYLDHYHKKYIPFLSSYIKFSSKKWKANRYLNVGKRIKVFREFSDNYIDFNQWKNDSINEGIHSK